MTGIFEGKKLLSVDEVAEALGVKPSTISCWIAHKFIPYIKFGEGKRALVRFSPRRLNQWLESLCREPANETGYAPRTCKLKKARKNTIDRFNLFAAET